MSARRRIERLWFLDDSEDEIYITRLLLRKERVRLDLSEFYNVVDLERGLADCDDDALSRSLLAVDLNLTLQSGTEVLRQIRSTVGTRLIAGICSGSEDPEDRRLALAAGADFYVGKPLNSARFIDIVAAVEGLSTDPDTANGLSLWRSPADPTPG